MLGKRILRKSVSGEQGFSLVELLIVIIVIGIILGGAVIAYVTSEGNTDARGAAEMVKQDLRKVYALAASGETVSVSGIPCRYRYRITFNGSSGSPPNSYVIDKGTPLDSGGYSYAPMTPDTHSANKVSTSGNYIEPSSNADTTIDYGSNPTIYFVSLGAITVANTDGSTTPGNEDDMKIIIKNGSYAKTITVSGYGNISD